MTPQEIQDIISQSIKCEYVLVESQDNVHFYVTVVSDEFLEMTKITQHKLVKELFKKQFIDGSVHAFSLKTYTSEKWAQKSKLNTQT